MTFKTNDQVRTKTRRQVTIAFEYEVCQNICIMEYFIYLSNPET